MGRVYGKSSSVRWHSNTSQGNDSVHEFLNILNDKGMGCVRVCECLF